MATEEEESGSSRLMASVLDKDESTKMWAYEQTEKQNNAIEQEIKASQPLVGDKLPCTALADAYNENDSTDYFHKAKELAHTYTHVRHVRGDGNCFYRALLFAQLERLLTDLQERERFTAVAKAWRKRLFLQGFPEFTTDDFCEWFDELLDDIQLGKIDHEKLHQLMNDDGPSNYYVTFFRLVTSGYLQERAEHFQDFIDDGRTVAEFCKSEVDPMWKECDHVCIAALVQGLGIPIRIEYMDRTHAPGGRGHHYDFTENDQPPQLFFLYRPGHYDILYK